MVFTRFKNILKSCLSFLSQTSWLKIVVNETTAVNKGGMCYDSKSN